MDLSGPPVSAFGAQASLHKLREVIDRYVEASVPGKLSNAMVS
jgi:hypothetical protein